jgi:predicted nucleic acid-binding protein
VNEKLITLRDLNSEDRLRQLVCAIGPTDAGLLALANLEGCLLLTNDGRLYNWLGAFPRMKIELVENLVGY